MPGVTAEQIASVREIDLLSYLKAYEPYELKPDGPNRYTTVTHSSLVISKGKWIWNRGGVGGVSALDYLISVRGIGFVEAVEMLSGGILASVRPYQEKPKEQPQEKKKIFYPPKPSRFANNAVSYLRERGISSDIIGRCLKEGILYESRYNNMDVCVFIGKDEVGSKRFACMRGINTNLKQDVQGSDKRYSFCLSALNPGSSHLAVFEAPIDLLSHATLGQRESWKWNEHRLSLGGTSSVAVMAFLERNPQIMRVALCLDNDEAGQKAAMKIKDGIAADKRFEHIKVSINPPAKGKDYNDTLLQAIRLEREQKQNSSHRDTGILL